MAPGAESPEPKALSSRTPLRDELKNSFMLQQTQHGMHAETSPEVSDKNENQENF